MKINFWDCKYSDYDESWDGEEEYRYYMCRHPDNDDAWCGLDNKWADMKDDCPYLDKKQ